MDKNVVLEKIKEQVKGLFKSAELLTQKFVEVKSVEGMIYSTPADKFDVNVTITCKDKDGNDVPVADGDINLEDGTILTVKGGVVVAVKVKDGEKQTESPVEEASVNAEAPVDAPKEVEAPNPLEDRVKTLEGKLDEVLAILETLVPGVADMSKKVDEFSKAPAEGPIATTLVAQRELTLEELRLQRIQGMYKATKNKK